MLAWLSVWSEVQTCIWPSWCHCHSLSLASVKSRLVLPFWYRLTRVVPEKGPLNVCVCVCRFLIHTETVVCLCSSSSSMEEHIQNVYTLRPIKTTATSDTITSTYVWIIFGRNVVMRELWTKVTWIHRGFSAHLFWKKTLDWEWVN